MRLTRLPQGVLAILLALGLVAADCFTSPALADSYQRTRNSASKFWTPTFGTATVSPHVGGVPKVRWTMRWDQQWEMLDLQGPHHALEAKIRVSRDWASEYSLDGFSMSNFPSSSRPYRDTSLSDSPSAPFTPAYGVADSNYLAPGVNYFAEVAIRRNAGLTESFEADVLMVASTRRDHDIVGCSNQAILAFCVFNDYSHTVVRGRDFRVQGDNGPFETWAGSYVINHSFENFGTSEFNLSAGAASDVWCFAYGRRSNCFLSFLGSGPVHVWQDVPYPAIAGDNYVAEASLKCPSGGPDCSASLAYIGLGGVSESRSQTVIIPANDYWYDCRVDFEHGGAAPFVSSHSQVRVQVTNLTANRYLDVDQVAFGLNVDRVGQTAGDSNPPAVGPTCRLGDVW